MAKMYNNDVSLIESLGVDEHYILSPLDIAAVKGDYSIETGLMVKYLPGTQICVEPLTEYVPLKGGPNKLIIRDKDDDYVPIVIRMHWHGLAVLMRGERIGKITVTPEMLDFKQKKLFSIRVPSVTLES